MYEERGRRNVWGSHVFRASSNLRHYNATLKMYLEWGPTVIDNRDVLDRGDRRELDRFSIPSHDETGECVGLGRSSIDWLLGSRCWKSTTELDHRSRSCIQRRKDWTTAVVLEIVAANQSWEVRCLLVCAVVVAVPLSLKPYQASQAMPSNAKRCQEMPRDVQIACRYRNILDSISSINRWIL